MLRTLERTHELRFSVPAHVSSLGIVRRAVLGLSDVCGKDTAARLAVIFSELVTNAIRHAGVRPNSKLDVALVIEGGSIFGSVVDRGHGFDPEALPEPTVLQEGGFGLRIVDELASHWGVSDNGNADNGQTEVWFEL